MTDQSSQFPKFYMTTPCPCPYLEGKIERKIFTELKDQRLNYDKQAILQQHHGQNANNYAENLHHSLALVGFRRSQDIAYRPACTDCSECKSVRVPVLLFVPSKSQRRIIKKNEDISVKLKPNTATDEQYDLLSKYINTRHPLGGMVGISKEEYGEMVECSPIKSHIFEYRLNTGKLVGVVLCDEMLDGFSMVYSFFDVTAAMNKRSLGAYMVLNQIDMLRSQGLDYVYLGYLVKDSPKMSYKMNFQPLETLYATGWKIMK